MAAERELSGSAAAKVKAAVLAKFPGATIDRMSAEDTADGTKAAYEVHVRKADGTRVEVLLDKNFAITTTRPDARFGGPGGPGGPHARAEQQLAGATAGKVKAAVLAKLPGSTVDRMSAEDPNEGSGAAYEAHVTKPDGSHVVVLLDKNLAVKATRPDVRPGGFGGPMGGPPAGVPGTAGAASTGNAGSGAVSA